MTLMTMTRANVLITVLFTMMVMTSVDVVGDGDHSDCVTDADDHHDDGAAEDVAG